VPRALNLLGRHCAHPAPELPGCALAPGTPAAYFGYQGTRDVNVGPLSVNHFSTLKSGGDVTGLQSREGGESRQQRASPRRVQQPCRLSRATARRWRRSPASGCGHVGKTSCTTRPRRPRCGAQRGGAWGAGPRAAASRRTPRTASSSRRSAGSARKCAASTCGSSGAG